MTILEVALEMDCRGITMLRVSLEHSDATKFLIISKSVIETLENHGCLQGLDSTAQMELFNH